MKIVFQVKFENCSDQYKADPVSSKLSTQTENKHSKILDDVEKPTTVAEANDKQSKSNKVSDAQDVSESQTHEPNENELSVNILNETGAYVCIEVDDLELVCICNAHSTQETNFIGEKEPCDNTKASTTNTQELNETGNSEQEHNYITLLDEPQIHERTTFNTSEHKHPKLSKHAEELLSDSDDDVQITAVIVPRSSEISDVKIKSEHQRKYAHVSGRAVNNVTSTQRPSKHKLYKCDLKIELDVQQPLAKRMNKKYENTSKGDSLNVNTQVPTTQQKLSGSQFCSCDSEEECPKSVNRTEATASSELDENMDDTQITCIKVPASRSPSGPARASEHGDATNDLPALKTKRQIPRGIYTGDVSFARAVLERWIRENVKDRESEN